MNKQKVLKSFRIIEISLVVCFFLISVVREYDLFEFYIFVFFIIVNAVSLVPFLISFVLFRQIENPDSGLAELQVKNRKTLAKILFWAFVIISIGLFIGMIYFGNLPYTKSFQ